MKTLKQLALVALVCYGASAIAMVNKEFWILNKSSYEITVNPKGLSSAPEQIAAGKASDFTALSYDIQSKHANGMITINDERTAQYAKLNKDGTPGTTKNLDISNNKNVFVVDVGMTTGFSVTTMTASDAKSKYPKSGLVTVGAMTTQDMNSYSKQDIAKLKANVESKERALKNIKFAKEHGIHYELVPLDKSLLKFTPTQIQQLTNAELYRIYGFDGTPDEDGLISFARWDMKTRMALVLDTLVNKNTDLQTKRVWEYVLLTFEDKVLLPSLNKALDKKSPNNR